MAKKSTKKPVSFQDKLKTMLEKEQGVYEKQGIGRRFVIVFPNRQNKKAPLLGRIGVSLLGMSGGQIQIQYDEIKQK
jgi:hypothetical protein